LKRAGADVLALLDEEGDGERAEQEYHEEEGRDHGPDVFPRNLEGADALVVVRDEHERPARSWHVRLAAADERREGSPIRVSDAEGP